MITDTLICVGVWFVSLVFIGVIAKIMFYIFMLGWNAL